MKHQNRVALENVFFHDQHPAAGDSRREVLAGLQRQPKVVNPKFFYDTAGSALFDRITRLPEYYPTRTEIGILTDNAEEIANCCGRGCVLIEPGSGSSEKVRLLLEAMRPAAYVPLDISADFLYQSAQQLGAEFPWLRIHAICADFSHDWHLSTPLPAGRRVVFYPGSTIGNLEPAAAGRFLARVRDWMGADGGAIIGADLHKSTDILTRAYNDAEGVTAAFNLNLLESLNRLLGARFDRDSFRHLAYYDTEQRRIEMHLVSREEQVVPYEGGSIDFAAGETIHTENSYKYTREGFAELAERAGLVVRRTWLDSENLFSVHYLECR